jgi:hypothetical protein
MKKYIIVNIIIILTLYLLVYLFISYYLLDFNLLNWDVETRKYLITAIITILIIVPILSMFYHLERD